MRTTVSDPPRATASGATVDGSDVVLRDGSTIHLRPTGPGDVEGVAAFLRGLSPDATWFRFLGPGPQEDRAARTLVERGTGLIAVAGPEETVVAHACFVPETRDRAELAFAVVDAWQNRGIATLLLAHLAQFAQASGIVTFVAWVHPANRRMLHVFRDSGFPIKVRSEPGVLQIELPSQLGQEAIDHFEERDRIGAVAAVRHVIEPASIAVIGASRRRVSVGGRSSANSLPARSPGRSIRSTRTRRPSPAGEPTHRSQTSPGPWNWPSSPSPRRLSRRPRGHASSKVSACSWCSRPASAKTARRASRGRRSCWGSAGRRACGSSGPTASACSTRPLRCTWTPRSRRVVRRRAASRSPLRAVPTV